MRSDRGMLVVLRSGLKRIGLDRRVVSIWCSTKQVDEAFDDGTGTVRIRDAESAMY